MAEEMAMKADNARAMNEAENAMSPEVIDLARDKARLEALPKIVEQMVRPAEKIDSIKIHHITGGALDRSGSSGGGGGDEPGDDPVVRPLARSIHGAKSKCGELDRVARSGVLEGVDHGAGEDAGGPPWLKVSFLEREVLGAGVPADHRSREGDDDLR